MLRRSLMLLTVTALAFAVLPAAASADVGKNPNVLPAEDLVCDNGLTSDELLIVGRTGHVPPGTTGVATKVELEVAPGAWVTVFDVPGVGLDRLKTHCTWTGAEGGPNFRGEILLRGNLR